jgi:predicted molibdopterin-dependent oxidoreductase YjgC
MFRRLPDAVPEACAAVNFSFDGRPVAARPGDSVAAALLAAGVGVFRATAVSGAARGPYCLMGVCFDCLVAIDGVGNRQACMVAVREGMAVRTQNGPHEPAPAGSGPA